VTDGDAVQESNPTIEEEKTDAQVWDAVKSKLEETWDRANYVTWVEKTTFLECAEGIFIIGAPNSYICDMLQYRLIDDLKPALVEIAGTDADVEFRVHRHRPTLEELNQENPLFDLLGDTGSMSPIQIQPLQDELVSWFDGMTETTAEELVEEYGEEWVRVVAQYARDNRQKLKNPAGFIISELKNNRLGLKPQLAVAG
jgi:chromosomal replication initiation ATPase DnaA